MSGDVDVLPSKGLLRSLCGSLSNHCVGNGCRHVTPGEISWMPPYPVNHVPQSDLRLGTDVLKCCLCVVREIDLDGAPLTKSRMARCSSEGGEEPRFVSNYAKDRDEEEGFPIHEIVTFARRQDRLQTMMRKNVVCALYDQSERLQFFGGRRECLQF